MHRRNQAKESKERAETSVNSDLPSPLLVLASSSAGGLPLESLLDAMLLTGPPGNTYCKSSS